MLFIRDLLATSTFGALTITVKTKNKRLKIWGTKYTLERLLVRQAIVTLAVCRELYWAGGSFTVVLFAFKCCGLGKRL